MLNKKRIIGIIGIVLCAVVLIFLFSKCGGSPLVGQWEAVGDLFVPVDYGSIKEFEFFSDGTYTSNQANYAGNYSVEGNRLKISGILASPKTFSFKVRGDILSLYLPEYEEYVFEFKRVQ